MDQILPKLVDLVRSVDHQVDMAEFTDQRKKETHPTGFNKYCAPTPACLLLFPGSVLQPFQPLSKERNPPHGLQLILRTNLIVFFFSHMSGSVLQPLSINGKELVNPQFIS